MERGGGRAVLSIDTANPLSVKNPHYLVMEVLDPGKGAGVRNLGYNSGFAVKEGEAYLFTCYTKNLSGKPEGLQVTLEGQDGRIYAGLTFQSDGGTWENRTAGLSAGKRILRPGWC